MLHKQAEIILAEHRRALNGLAALLIERRFLSAGEIAEALERFGIGGASNYGHAGK